MYIRDFLPEFFSFLLLLSLMLSFMLILTLSSTSAGVNDLHSSADIFLESTDFPLNKLNFSLFDPLTNQLALLGFHNITITFGTSIEGFLMYNHSLLDNMLTKSATNISTLLNYSDFETYSVEICNSYFFKMFNIPLVNNSLYLLGSELPSNATVSFFNWKDEPLLANMSIIDLSSTTLLPFTKYSYGGGVGGRFILPVSSISSFSSNASMLTPFPNWIGLGSTQFGMLFTFPQSANNFLGLADIVKETFYYSNQVQNIVNKLFKVNIVLGILPIGIHKWDLYSVFINLYGIEVCIFSLPLLLLTLYLNNLSFSYQRKRFLQAIEISNSRGGDFIRIIRQQAIKVWFLTLIVSFGIVYCLVYLFLGFLKIPDLQFYESASLLALLTFASIFLIQKMLYLNNLTKPFLMHEHAEKQSQKAHKTLFSVLSLIGMLCIGAILVFVFDITASMKSLLLTFIMLIILVLIFFLLLTNLDYFLVKKNKHSLKEINVDGSSDNNGHTRSIIMYMETLKDFLLDNINRTLIKHHLMNYLNIQKNHVKILLLIGLFVLPTIVLVQNTINTDISITTATTVLGDITIWNQGSSSLYLKEDSHVQSYLTVNYTSTTITNPLNQKDSAAVDTLPISDSILPFIHSAYPYLGSIEHLLQFNESFTSSSTNTGPSRINIPIIISTGLANHFSLFKKSTFTSPSLPNATCFVLDIIPSFPGLSHMPWWILTLSSSLPYYSENVGMELLALKLTPGTSIPNFVENNIYLPLDEVDYNNQQAVFFTPILLLLDLNRVLFLFAFILVLVHLFWGYFKDLHTFTSTLQVHGLDMFTRSIHYTKNVLNIIIVTVQLFLPLGICFGFLSVALNVIIGSILGLGMASVTFTFFLIGLYTMIFLAILTIFLVCISILYVLSLLLTTFEDSYAFT